MKLLVYTTLYPNAEQPNLGLFVERRLQELVQRHPCEVRVVAPVPWFPRWLRGKRYTAFSRIPDREVRGGIEIHHPRYLVVPKLTWRIAPLMLVAGSIGTIRRLRRQGFDYDVIDAHFVFPDGVAAQMIGSTAKKPVCVTARGSDINDSPRYWLPRRAIRWALGRARAVVAVSGDLSKKMREVCGERLTVHVLPNGVDRTRFYPRDEPLIAEEKLTGGRVVLAVGNLRELKGHDILIRAIALLRDVSLIIVGTGEEEAKLRRLIIELGVADRVHLVGAVDNDALPAYYSAASVFALASSSEGCPNVVLEAIACGTPVVATSVGGIPDLLPASALRFLVTERSAEAFAEAIRSCLEDPPARQDLLDRAAEFGWGSTCSRLHDLLLACIGDSRASAGALEE